MSTTRIKEKLSSIVSSQLPEFVQADYTKFVAFIEAYYKFLEQDQGAYELIQNSSSYNDIDSTTEAFVKYFLKNYVKDFPLSTLANKKLLVKRIKDLYEAKGSEVSLKYIFNIIFEVDVDVTYPYENVLIASGGNWNQRYSLHVETTTGNPFLINNRFLQYTDNNIVYSTPITETRPFDTNITEIFLDRNFLAPNYDVGQTVIVNDGGTNVIFSGNILPTLTTVTVGSPGAGFKIGKIYSIYREGGRGSLVKITNVNSTGGITEAKIIGYGTNYGNTSFSTTLDKDRFTSESVEQYYDSTLGFISTGAIYKFDPTDTSNHYFSLDYLDANSYTFTSFEGTFANNTSVNVFSTTSVSNTEAVITLSPGALGKYPGTFITNDSLISELDIRLEDDRLYQPFAYLTTTTIDYNEFSDIIKQTVHPAGQRLFNNRLLRSNIDLNSNVTINVIPFISVQLAETFEVLDQATINFGKNITDVLQKSDNTSFVVNKPIDETLYANSQFSLSFRPSISDSITVTEDLIDIQIGRVLYDNQSVNENLIFDINKGNINISATPTEFLVVIDPDFFLEDYTSNDYAGTEITST